MVTICVDTNILALIHLIREWTISLMRELPGRMKQPRAPVSFIHALRHSIIALLLMHLCTAAFRPDPATVLGPSAHDLLVRVVLALRR